MAGGKERKIPSIDDVIEEIFEKIEAVFLRLGIDQDSVQISGELEKSVFPEIQNGINVPGGVSFFGKVSVPAIAKSDFGPSESSQKTEVTNPNPNFRVSKAFRSPFEEKRRNLNEKSQNYDDNKNPKNNPSNNGKIKSDEHYKQSGMKNQCHRSKKIMIEENQKNTEIHPLSLISTSSISYNNDIANQEMGVRDAENLGYIEKIDFSKITKESDEKSNFTTSRISSSVVTNSGKSSMDISGYFSDINSEFSYMNKNPVYANSFSVQFPPCSRIKNNGPNPSNMSVKSSTNVEDSKTDKSLPFRFCIRFIQGQLLRIFINKKPFKESRL